MEFHAIATRIIEAHHKAIIHNEKRDLHKLIADGLKEAYYQGKADYKQTIKKRKKA